MHFGLKAEMIFCDVNTQFDVTAKSGNVFSSEEGTVMALKKIFSDRN